MKKKNSKKVLAGVLMMCFVVQGTIPNTQVNAKGKEASKESGLQDALDHALNSNLTMEEAQNDLHNNDKKDDDGDGLLNYWEDSIGTDKRNPDTDGDGLTDYQEVTLTGTDPLLADTNGNGISDADEDTDGDGISNIDEIKLGTNPLVVDTDEDGLSDWDEVYKYGTNPTIYDTDKDGASDGLEVEKRTAGVKGFDPLVANKKMDQRLKEEVTVEEPAMTLNNMGRSRTISEKDSDFDGIPDSEDTAPFERGLKGGIVGSLQIVGSHHPDAAFTEGHSFLVYTSYVNGQPVNINEMYGSYEFNKADYGAAIEENEILLSWRSKFKECTPENDAERKVIADDMWRYKDNSVKSYQLNRGDYVSIGNFTQNSYMDSLKDAFLNSQSGTMMEAVALQALYEEATGMKVDVMYIMTHLQEVTELLADKSYIKGEEIINGKTDGGIWVNREMYDQRYQYDQYPHEIYKVDITQSEFNIMMDAVNKNNYYSIINHNCTSVAANVWNATVGYKADMNGICETDQNGNRIKSDLYITSRGKGALAIVDFPGAVCESILKLKENGTSRGKYYSDYSNIVQAAPAN